MMIAAPRALWGIVESDVPYTYCWHEDATEEGSGLR